MVSLRQRVITLHGVNPDRDWQPAARSVLEPHFDCIAIDYHGYDGMQGPIRVVCHPLGLLLAGLAVIAAMGAAMAGARLLAAECSIVAVSLFGVALAAARYERVQQARRIKKKISELGQSPPRPHLIAHSFGTYLAGRSLQHPDITLGRIALVGTILPRSFDWKRLCTGGRQAFQEVRNEVGAKDFAVWLAGRMRWLAWDIGDAGRRGFNATALVHQTAGPWQPCADCVNELPEASVHNVPLDEMGHSDAFLGPGHARRLWLPFLWGFSPVEFDQFVSLCWDAAYKFQEDLLVEFDLDMKKLADSRWTWTGDKRLLDFVIAAISRERRGKTVKATASIHELAIEAMRVMSDYVARAACGLAEGPTQQRALYPAIAVVQAVQTVLKESP